MSLINLDEGQDSFLDIIANLVGVLIILVVVVGAQATSSLVSSVEPEPAEPLAAVPLVTEVDETAFEAQRAALQEKLSTAENASSRLRFDRTRLEHQANDEKKIAQKLATRRHAMLLQLQNVKQAHEQRKQAVTEKLSQQQQQQLQLQSEKIQLVTQLESLQQTINAVAATRVETAVETIDHYPNPIAKTVFSNEVHFRLENGRLSYVPMDELLAQMKSELRLKAEKLQQADQTRETIGPVDGFRLQYKLGVVPQKESKPSAGRVVRFERFVIHPVTSLGGEKFDEALGENSKFAQRLQRFDPKRTTVSVWVYPNSFEEHAVLKEWLYERGFQMASWPLAKGRPISGGPNGFRTSAQ